MNSSRKQIKPKDGSQIAKGGLKYEREVAAYLNAWKTNKDGQGILIAMGYSLEDIEWVSAERAEERRKRLCKELGITLHKNQKADVVADIKTKSDGKIRTETISAKSVSKDLNKNDTTYKGFGQVDKRPIDAYAELWNLDPKNVKTLKYFTGELAPYKKDTEKSERMFMYEMKSEEVKPLLEELEEKKVRIFYDTFMGVGPLSAKWMIIGLKQFKGTSQAKSWTMHKTIDMINFYIQGKTKMSRKGSIKLGCVTMQRKGGDKGSKSAEYLQFKIDPLLLIRDVRVAKS